MGALFGGDSPAMNMTPPPPPPPPPVIEDTAAKQQDEKKRFIDRDGVASTLLTGVNGTGAPATGSKTLLGA